jgi:hypothetical protein
MDEHRDDLDGWLRGQIEPLPPPEGTFELIRRRARRRKIQKAAIAAAGSAAVIVALVAIPRVATSVLHIGTGLKNSGTAAGATTPAPSSNSGRSGVSSLGTVTPDPSPPPVPADFAATSVTFIGTETGWVIGQAGTPGDCATQYCTSVARTDDAGASWYGVHAPLTGAPDGASGVSQIRFLNTLDGWAFGPELWATHDGGHTWTQIPTGGLRVTDLETVGDRAFAVLSACSGTGTAFAAGCTSFSLYSAVASGDSWSAVGNVTSGLRSGNLAGAASIVLTGTVGYLYAPSGALYDGPVDGSGSWRKVAPYTPVSFCAPGQAQQDGQPAGALLAAIAASRLVLACNEPVAGGPVAKQVRTSQAGVTGWHGVPHNAPGTGTATSVAGAPDGTIVLATTQGIDVLPSGSTTWQRAAVSGGVPAGGFAYVGMTTSVQGVAVPADAAEHAVWFTSDGGLTWHRSAITGS